MTDRSLSSSVETTITALETGDVESAAVELARLYAAEIDGAAAWRGRADRHARRVREELGPDSALYEETEVLRAKLSERAALAGIGKLLHALLAELCATPKARGGAKRPPAGDGKLAKLRAVR